jgi:cardiolipin synthase
MGKKKKKKIDLKSVATTVVFSFLLLCCFWIVDTVAVVRLPQADKPIELYANQVRDDLSKTLITSINEAKESIHLIIYSLTDNGIISSLRKKSEEGVKVTVVLDAKATPYAAKKLGPKVTTRKRFSKGLMHQKILVIDGEQVWIGSANMTSESLRLHGNLLMAFYSPEIAKMACEGSEKMFDKKKNVFNKPQTFSICGQDIEFWLLPNNFEAVPRLKQLINTAQKTIRIAMFTWTRYDLAKAIIEAKQRGVNTEVVIDHYSGNGVSAKVVQMLRDGGVSTRLSKGGALLHHKFLYIDSKTLVNGSANWTKAAFTKNDDCFMILHGLNDEQKSHMNSLWDVIVAESSF